MSIFCQFSSLTSSIYWQIQYKTKKLNTNISWKPYVRFPSNKNYIDQCTQSDMMNLFKWSHSQFLFSWNIVSNLLKLLYFLWLFFPDISSCCNTRLFPFIHHSTIGCYTFTARLASMDLGSTHWCATEVAPEAFFCFCFVFVLFFFCFSFFFCFVFVLWVENQGGKNLKKITENGGFVCFFLRGCSKGKGGGRAEPPIGEMPPWCRHWCAIIWI